MIRVILAIHSGLFWALTNSNTNIRLWKYSLLEMQRTGCLRHSLRLVLSILQLSKKEKKNVISPQFYDKLSNPYNLVMINLLFVNE